MSYALLITVYACGLELGVQASMLFPELGV